MIVKHDFMINVNNAIKYLHKAPLTGWRESDILNNLIAVSLVSTDKKHYVIKFESNNRFFEFDLINNNIVG